MGGCAGTQPEASRGRWEGYGSSCGKVIVPPEYRRLGSLPPEQFIPQLMARLRQSPVTATMKKPQRHWRDYRTAAGGRPVKAFIDALTDAEVASIVAGMKDVVARGLPSAKHLRGDIYEVRADASTRSFRLLFAAEGKYSQVLLSLSVFEKRTRKTPPRELDLAESRLREWRHRGTARKNAAARPERS
jgi:phage-related protein